MIQSFGMVIESDNVHADKTISGPRGFEVLFVSVFLFFPVRVIIA